jgi:hypothetical protein
MTVILECEENLPLISFCYVYVKSDWTCILSYKSARICYTKYGLAYQKITVEKIKISLPSAFYWVDIDQNIILLVLSLNAFGW